jgi:hypothetical protein
VPATSLCAVDEVRGGGERDGGLGEGEGAGSAREEPEPDDEEGEVGEEDEQAGV